MPGELSGQVAAHTPVHYVAGLNFRVFASMVVCPPRTKRRNYPQGWKYSDLVARDACNGPSSPTPGKLSSNVGSCWPTLHASRKSEKARSLGARLGLPIVKRGPQRVENAWAGEHGGGVCEDFSRLTATLSPSCSLPSWWPVCQPARRRAGTCLPRAHRRRAQTYEGRRWSMAPTTLSPRSTSTPTQLAPRSPTSTTGSRSSTRHRRISTMGHLETATWQLT